MEANGTFAEVEQALPTPLEVAQIQVRNLMQERDVLRYSLKAVVETVSKESNYNVWAANLQTCIYTKDPFADAREILGMPTWVDVLAARGEFE